MKGACEHGGAILSDNTALVNGCVQQECDGNGAAGPRPARVACGWAIGRRIENGSTEGSAGKQRLGRGADELARVENDLLILAVDLNGIARVEPPFEQCL